MKKFFQYFLKVFFIALWLTILVLGIYRVYHPPTYGMALPHGILT
jgi:hypothetical protein